MVALIWLSVALTSFALAEQGSPVTITDMTGREITLEKPAERIVALTASDCEILFAIGALMGKNEEADAVIANMKATFEKVASLKSDIENETVYFEVSPLEYGLWTAGKGTFMDEIASMLGLENCFSDIDDWAEISEEQILKRDFISAAVGTSETDGVRPSSRAFSISGFNISISRSSSRDSFFLGFILLKSPTALQPFYTARAAMSILRSGMKCDIIISNSLSEVDA